MNVINICPDYDPFWVTDGKTVSSIVGRHCLLQQIVSLMSQMLFSHFTFIFLKMNLPVRMFVEI